MAPTIRRACGSRWVIDPVELGLSQLARGHHRVQRLPDHGEQRLCPGVAVGLRRAGDDHELAIVNQLSSALAQERCPVVGRPSSEGVTIGASGYLDQAPGPPVDRDPATDLRGAS
jgi:hypothetical protein